MALTDALLLDPQKLDLWIALRTDGVKGTGSEADPWDGSTAEKFDAIMASVPANTTVRLGPGVFETKGYAFGPGGWQPKSGQKIIGSGMGLTTLKIVGATVANEGYFALAHNFFTNDPASNLDYFEASDFTIDCNLGGQPVPAGFYFAPLKCAGVQIRGKHVRIRRIRIINFGTQMDPTNPGSECFVLDLAWQTPGIGEEVDCVIEECIVEKLAEQFPDDQLHWLWRDTQRRDPGLSPRVRGAQLCGGLRIHGPAGAHLPDHHRGWRGDGHDVRTSWAE